MLKIGVSTLEGLTWQKSGRCDGGGCVEAAKLPNGTIAFRNSGAPQGPALLYTQIEIEAFIGGVKDGDFDHLVS